MTVPLPACPSVHGTKDISSDMDKALTYQILITAALIICGISDLKTRSFSSIPIIVCGVAGFFLSAHPWLCILPVLSGLFLKRVPIKSVGAGDIDALLLLITGDVFCIVITALVAGVLSVIYYITRRDNAIPFVAMLAGGSIISFIVKML